MTDNADILIVLKSIDMTLRELLALSKSKRAAGAATVQPTSNIAADAELDSEYGDEKLNAKMPNNWTGEDYKGKRMSECPPELLDMLADRHDFFADKNRAAGDAQKAGYEVRSARRARGWAQRKRNGWVAKTVEPMSSDSVQW